MLTLIFGVLKVVGLRTAAGAVGLAGAAGSYLAVAGVVLGLLWGLTQYGRHLERVEAAQIAAQREARALREAFATTRKVEERAAADDVELAAKDQQEARVRNETNDDGAVLWGVDDGWLRSKR